MNDPTSWLSTILVVGLLLISLNLWTHIIRRQRAGQGHFFSAQERLKLPLGLVDVLLAFVMWMMGQIVGLAISFAILGIDGFDPGAPSVQQQTVLGYAVGICTVASTGLTLTYLYARYKSASVFGIGQKNFRRNVVSGAVVFLCFVPITFLVQALLTQIWEYEHPTLDLISPDASWLTILSAWWMAVLVAPIAEEIFFRGVLQGWLSRLFVNDLRPEAKLIGGWPVGQLIAGNAESVSFDQQLHPSRNAVSTAESISANAQVETNPYESPTNPSNKPRRASDESLFYVAQSWVPVVVSAVLFGLVHLGQGPAPIPIFVFGLGLGLIYRQTGSIVPCIVAHFMLNCFSMTAYTIEQLFFPADAVEELPELAPAVSWLASLIV